MQGVITKEGFNFGFDPFKCSSCEGNCCIGESGYIWCTPKEINDMSQFLGDERGEFTLKYTKKIGYKISLCEIESKGNFSCIFFDLDKKACQIYPVRPKQCRTFPFWKHFNENIKEVVKECPGIII